MNEQVSNRKVDLAGLDLVKAQEAGVACEIAGDVAFLSSPIFAFFFSPPFLFAAPYDRDVAAPSPPPFL